MDVLRSDGSGRVSPDEEHTYSSKSNIFSLGHEHLGFFNLLRKRIYSPWSAKLSYKGRRILVSPILSIVHVLASWNEASSGKYCHADSSMCPGRSTARKISSQRPKGI